MSYSISWKIEAKTKTPFFVDIADYPRRQDNITYNVKHILELSTGMEWSDGDKGLVGDIIPRLKNAIKDIKANPNYYRSFEPANGYGSVEGVISLFENLILDYQSLKSDEVYGVIADEVHFVIS